MSLTAIQDRIAKAQTQAGGPVGAVTLIAVSKLQPIVRLQQVLLQGHQVFGENYVQETAQKWPALRFGTLRGQGPYDWASTKQQS